MVDDEKAQVIADFVARYTALPTEPGMGADAPTGYFAFYAGRSHRQAAAARRRIEVRAGVDRSVVFAQVMARVRDVVTSGEGNCYLRFYWTGESHPEEQVMIPGSVEQPDETGIDDGTVLGSLTGALVSRSRADADRIKALESRLDRAYDVISEGREQVTLLAVAHNVMASANRQQTVQAVMQGLAPTLQQGAAVVAQMLMQQAQSQQPTDGPTDPAARIAWVVDRIARDAAELIRLANANPASVGIALEPLRPFVAALAQFFNAQPPQEA